MRGSHAAAFRRAAPVVRERRHIADQAHFETDLRQSANRRLATRTRSLDIRLDTLQTVLLCAARGGFGGELRRERRSFFRALETDLTCRRPGNRLALNIGQRNDRVIERAGNMSDTLRDIFSHLRRFLSCRLRGS